MRTGGIKIAGRNINHLKYADDTTLMAESEEELKSLLTTLYTLQQLHGAGRAERTYPTSKIRSNGCTLLEQP